MAKQVDQETNGEHLVNDTIESRAPELFFGIVGGVGTDLGLVQDILARELKAARYVSNEVRISALLSDCSKYSHLNEFESPPEHDRISAFMDAGDDIRRTAGRGDALAIVALGKIRDIRSDKPTQQTAEGIGQAYILNSLKHPEEVDLFKKVYGPSFFLIAVYESRERRKDNLCELVAKSVNKYDGSPFEEQATDLIDRDEKDVSDDLGQNVRDAFEKADLFLSAMEHASLEQQIRRFVKLLFRHPHITPTVEEYSMFHAKATALRSADLSRQVGAVISAEEGEILAAGCNEVPKPGGGSIWDGRSTKNSPDNRDFVIGYDPSVRMAHELISELLDRLSASKWLKKKYRKQESSSLASDALFDGPSPPLKGTRAASILEFGRVVHAEMSAITDAAARGISIRGATLFCTTFPCHMCARHIMAAGISKVIYIEPYPKSLTKVLYGDDVNVDHEPAREQQTVSFVPFTGIAPRRYIELFEKTEKRKDERGRALDWSPEKSIPRAREISVFTVFEAAYLEYLGTNLVEWGIISNDSGHSAEE